MMRFLPLLLILASCAGPSPAPLRAPLTIVLEPVAPSKPQASPRATAALHRDSAAVLSQTTRYVVSPTAQPAVIDQLARLSRNVTVALHRFTANKRRPADLLTAPAGVIACDC